MRAVPVFSAPPRARRWPSALGWLSFVTQLLLVEIFDAANDVIRGDLLPPSPSDAIDNARQVAHFEAAHGSFIEPGMFRFVQSSHHFLGVVVPTRLLLDSADNIYAFFHVGVPILVAGWIFVQHRDRFGLLRNALILCSLVALLGYFIYPVAPPRLTTGLTFDGRPFQFHDTMPYPRNSVMINGRPLGFNPYAAMPSLHIAWATTVSVTVFLLSRNWVARGLAVLYPVIMTLAIVATANHYLMDAMGGLVTTAVAFPLAFALERYVRRVSGAR